MDNSWYHAAIKDTKQSVCTNSLVIIQQIMKKIHLSKQNKPVSKYIAS